jgi:HAD superfamily hydrolase (TIGR01509 family)
MSKLKLVIFDCDGVMFDSKEANRQYYNMLLKEFGRPDMSEEEVDYVHTHNVLDSVSFIFRNHPDPEDEVNRFREKQDYTPYLNHMIMEPDLKEFLRYLRPEHHTAISTNRAATMPAVLKMFELEEYFDKVVTSLDVERPKPHREALVKILDHFGLNAQEAVYIGDSMVDREHSAGVDMRLIAFKNPNLNAEYHVNSFMEITSLPIF